MQKLFWRQSVEVAHHAIVVNNLELGCRESYCKEEVVLFIACMIGICLGFLMPYKRGGSRTMMSVSNIQCRHIGKFGRNGIYGCLAIYDPEVVAETVIGYEVILGLGGGYALDDVVEHIVVFKGEEHRLDIGILGAYVFHTIFFFVSACHLEFLDDTIEVVVNVGCYHKSVLSTAVHSLGI